MEKNILAKLGCFVNKEKFVLLIKRSRNFYVKWRENFSSNVELNVERWTSNWTSNVEQKSEKVYAKKNQWIETQGYGSTVYPLGFSEFLGGGVG